MKPTPKDVRWLVDQLDDQKRRLQNLENRKPGLAYSSLEDGAIREYDKDGVLGSQTGKQPDGTHGSVVLNGPKPPKPTDPDVTAVPGMLEGRWNGKFAGDVVSPLDLKHVAMYAVLAGEVLDLSKQAGVMTGELGDNVQVQVDPGVYNVYLVAWSKAGRFSDAAGPVPVLVPVPADMESIQAALDDLDERYDGVITEAGTLGTRLDQAETDLVEHDGRLDANDASLTTLTGTTLPALNADLHAAKAQLAPLPGLIADNKTKVDAAKSRLDTLDSATLPGLSSDLTAAKTRLTAAENTLAPLPAKVATAQSDLTAAFGQLGTVDSRVATAKAAAQTAAAADAQSRADAALSAANAQIAQVVAKGQSLVLNGDFEAGQDGWGTSAFSAVESGGARSGTKAMRMGPNPGGNIWPLSLGWVPSSDGRTYYLEMWVRRTGAESKLAGVGFVVQYRTTTTTTITSGRVDSLTISETGWTKVTTTYTVPVSDATHVNFAPWISAGNNVYRVDDFLVVDVTEAKEALDKAAAAQFDASAALAKAGAAKDTADAALTMAGSKSVVYYSTYAPSGTATPGDVWRRIDASKNVIAEWFWDTAWRASQITNEMISNLDVGKLTAGAAVVDSAVINKLAVQIATVIQLNADRITAGTITSGQIDTPNLAAALATILKLNASAITAGTIAAARLDVVDLSARIATIISLNADRITAGTINTARLNVTEIAAQVATVIQLNADRIVAGTIATARLDVVDIAAKTAAFQQVDVKNLFATTGTMSEAVITKLFTDVVMSRKITTQMLAVGDFNNMAAVGLEAGSTKATGWASGLIVDTVDKPADAAFALKSTAGQGPHLPPSPYDYFDVTPGDELVWSMWIKASLPNTRYYSEVRDQTGNHAATWSPIPGKPSMNPGSAYPMGGGVNVPTAWTQYWAKGVVKAGVTQLAIRSLYFNHPSGSETGAIISVAGMSLRRKLAGELVVDGSIKAQHADLESFAADTGFVADLTARIVKADMFVGKEFHGGVFTGATFQTSILPDQGMKLDNAGLRAYGPDGGEPVAEIRPDGGTVYQVSDPATGEVLGGIGSDGGVTGTSLSVSDESRMDGPVIMGGDPLSGGHGSGLYGATMNGRDLLGATFANYVDEHPNVADGNAWLTVIPHGVVAQQEVSTPNQTWNATGGINHTRIRAVVTLNAVFGRMYQITYRTPAIRETSTLGGTIGGVAIAYSNPNGAISAGASGNNALQGSRYYLRGGDGFDQAIVTTYARCPEDIPAGKIMLGPELYIYSGRAAVASDTADTSRWSVTVADLGLRRSAYNGADIDSNKQGAANPTPPAPQPDPIKQYTDTVNASWWEAYLGSGGVAMGSAYNGAAAQGRTPYYTPNGVMRGLIGIPSQASRLSGSTVKKIEVYVYAKAWHASAGGTACIGVHGHASKPGSWSSTTNDVKRQKMKRPEGRWITLPSSVHAGFKNGNLRGISFLPPGSSTSTEYYGIFTGNKTKFRFTYTK